MRLKTLSVLLVPVVSVGKLKAPDLGKLKDFPGGTEQK